MKNLLIFENIKLIMDDGDVHYGVYAERVHLGRSD